MEVNFKGKYLNSTYVRKLNPSTKKYVPEMVHFVEINPRLKDDVKALKKMSKLWGEDSIFASSIFYFAKTDPRKRTFILTEQKDHFEKIEPQEILGITQLSKEIAGEHSIEYLETNPKYQFENNEREYKKIGSRILDGLKEVFQDKTLKVDYVFDRIDFYLHNGFNFRNEVLGDLIWKASERNSNL